MLPSKRAHSYKARTKYSTMVTAWCTHEMAHEVDIAAKRFNVSRAEMLRTFIEWGMQSIAEDLADGGRGGR